MGFSYVGAPQKLLLGPYFVVEVLNQVNGHQTIFAPATGTAYVVTTMFLVNNGNTCDLEIGSIPFIVVSGTSDIIQNCEVIVDSLHPIAAGYTAGTGVWSAYVSGFQILP